MVRLIDSTSLRLNTTLFGWAYRRRGKAGAKLHLVYDRQARCPVQFVITPARVNDITVAKRLSILPGRPMSSTWATTTMAGGRRWTRPAAALSAG